DGRVLVDLELRAALAGGDAADDARAVAEASAGVDSAEGAGGALADDFGRCVNEHAHGLPPGRTVGEGANRRTVCAVGLALRTSARRRRVRQVLHGAARLSAAGATMASPLTRTRPDKHLAVVRIISGGPLLVFGLMHLAGAAPM